MKPFEGPLALFTVCRSSIRSMSTEPSVLSDNIPVSIDGELRPELAPEELCELSVGSPLDIH